MNRLVLFFRSKNGRYVSLLLLIFIVGWGFLRGCVNKTTFMHPRYTIAVDRTWQSVSVFGKENNLLAFTDELLAAITEESGIRFNLLETRTPNLLPGLENGLYDAVISTMMPTLMNEQKYNFSEPFYLLGPVLVVRIDSDITSLKDLSGRYMGVQRGMSLNFDQLLPNTIITPFDNATAAFAALESNKIDAVIMDSLQAYVQIQGIYSRTVHIVSKPFNKEGLRLITLKNPKFDELFTIFDRSINDLIENGKYAELLNKWKLYNPTK